MFLKISLNGQKGKKFVILFFFLGSQNCGNYLCFIEILFSQVVPIFDTALNALANSPPYNNYLWN